ncbi:family 2 encapsulin nanocompartment cargo protein terpene cyclase [Streptomyces sp. B-S-A8]|uniref:Terpene synthase n=1 Tax=Streptomyces solicavernae TaxID=3043614 RepID=A0ABT6RPT7_9ACTN|nr:family 2 encapsulin nanocompartment cargo protein terpene cyclase [Streptomyces sp. B-S-A8]MDI3386450.1 family 2 encapsulin nanocompartment cargo protein terpene cyclase [Streptomyces sp. B-S-A8]
MASSIPLGPTGMGTAGLRIIEAPPADEASAESAHTPSGEQPVRPIPGLRFQPAVQPDPALVAEVDRRTKEWAQELDLVPAKWDDQFEGFGFGRAVCLGHPDHADVDRLVVAARLLVAENVVDDCYCEDHGGSPEGLGARLLIAHSALDPLHTTPGYAAHWREGLRADAPLRAYQSAIEHAAPWAAPAQLDRLRHDLGRLHLGYLAEAAWSLDDTTPDVWEYLVMRQFNNFRPCLTLTDLVAGYELPAPLQALPALQRLTALAGNAATLVNDLYSYTKEKRSPRPHLNLPVVIGRREDLPEREAYLKALDVHNEIMGRFETESAQLRAQFPEAVLGRYLTGLAAWVAGNHEWHATNTFRYTLPDFWPHED